MEATELEAGNKNHLENVLSQSELEEFPKNVAIKINKYIDQKFEEYLTAKALHETNKTNIGKCVLTCLTLSRLLQFFAILFDIYESITFVKVHNKRLKECDFLHSNTFFIQSILLNTF